ncbi:proline-rich extensin-like protein EPR1 [Helianthus annuus]|uniref:proline-rich extensin-like protein EPR1 n=1 Tax=Helianthus annuus TaxID=4232 RepID=UPI000B8EEA1B|nr:proline-rich extensin-like protein EPR1 [Helianthus annuus]
MAPEQAVALDPILEHDPVHVGIPIEPVIADPPIDDHLMDAPLLEGDHVVAADPVVPPPVVDIPVDQPVDHIAPFPPVVPPVSPFHVAPFDPTSTPFLWPSPPVMPPTDPYHPFHMGHINFEKLPTRHAPCVQLAQL